MRAAGGIARQEVLYRRRLIFVSNMPRLLRTLKKRGGELRIILTVNNPAKRGRVVTPNISRSDENVWQELSGLNKICHVAEDAVAQLTTVAVFNIVIAIIPPQTANYKARTGQLHDLQALSEQLGLSTCRSGHLVRSDGWDLMDLRYRAITEHYLLVMCTAHCSSARSGFVELRLQSIFQVSTFANESASSVYYVSFYLKQHKHSQPLVSANLLLKCSNKQMFACQCQQERWLQRCGIN